MNDTHSGQMMVPPQKIINSEQLNYWSITTCTIILQFNISVTSHIFPQVKLAAR